MTATGQVMGTPSYMPPEQALGQVAAVGPLVDVYSLGATLFRLVTGRPPFQAASAVETIRHVVEQDPVAPSTLNPSVPRDLDTICIKCLRKELGKRYQTAAELAGDLRRWLDGEPIQARPVGSVERLWLWCRRKPVIAGSIVAILLTAWITVGFTLSERHRNVMARMRTAVAAMDSMRGNAVPLAIQDLQADGFRSSTVLRELRTRFAGARDNERLGLAYALAHFGDTRSAYLVEQMRTAPAAEAANIITALKHATTEASARITVAIEACDESQDWQYKARLAITAMFLGEKQAAMAISQPAADPTPRTVFIDELSNWHGDLVELSEIAQTMSDPQGRSAVALGVGNVQVESLTSEAPLAWRPVLFDWYQNRPDSGPHSAAGFALRQWGLGEPPIKPTRNPNDGRDWHINHMGLTMLRIPTGQFVRKARFPDPNDSQLSRIRSLC